jgi:hypothetical protein
MIVANQENDRPGFALFPSRFTARVLLSILGVAIAAAVALLPWESFGAPVSLLCVVGSLAFLLALADSNAEDRPFVVRLFLVALGVHLVAWVGFWWLSGGRQTYWLDDGRAYDRVGWAWALAWRAGAAMPAELGNLSWMTTDAFPRWVGGLYFLIGHSPAAVLAWQTVLAASSVYLAYRISSLLLGPVVARLTGWLMIAYTGYLLFTVMILKDSLILFLILLSFHAMFRVRETLDRPAPVWQKIIAAAGWLIVAIAAIEGVDNLRDYTALILIGGWILFACHWLIRSSGKWKATVFFGILIAGVLVLWWASPRILEKGLPPILIAPESTLLTVARPPVAETIGQFLDWAVFHPQNSLPYLLAASASTLIAPFAWIFPGMLPNAPVWSVYFIAYPGMWVWYMLVPFACIGLFSALRRTRGDILPILFFTAAMFLMVAILIPREVRHRDMMMPMALILAAEGVIHARRWAVLGFSIWLPLAGFIAWKMGVLSYFFILVAMAAFVLLGIMARRTRNERSRRIHGGA